MDNISPVSEDSDQFKSCLSDPGISIDFQRKNSSENQPLPETANLENTNTNNTDNTNTTNNANTNNTNNSNTIVNTFIENEELVSLTSQNVKSDVSPNSSSSSQDEEVSPLMNPAVNESNKYLAIWKRLETRKHSKLFSLLDILTSLIYLPISITHWWLFLTSLPSLIPFFVIPWNYNCYSTENKKEKVLKKFLNSASKKNVLPIHQLICSRYIMLILYSRYLVIISCVIRIVMLILLWNDVSTFSNILMLLLSFIPIISGVYVWNLTNVIQNSLNILDENHISRPFI
tara:strand:- start:216 stop:1079 length:864 start_codon:yes stop_codon:yes gene_type:complete